MRLLWFVPFVVAAALHLGALFGSGLGIEGAGDLASGTKPLIMLTLLGGFLAVTPQPRGRIAIWASAAMVLSLAGDVLFAQPGGIGFILGLGCFLLAHVAYTILFLGPLKRSGMPRLAALYGLWWFGLLAALLPHLGALAVPVVVYGGVLGLSAASALGTNRTIAVGALLFLLSDSVLAFKLFHPGFELWQKDFVIMVLYCAGQGLIALGVVFATRSRVSEQAGRTGA
jgi:alkenylglycerophosphocholine/alkenylglycerophosphoethanolamine hydrolase